MRHSKKDEDLTSIDRLCKALADPTRLRMLGVLSSGEVCVCHIQDSLGIPQPKASRHLAYLRRAGLVETRKRGLWVYYRLASRRDGVAQTILDAVQHCIGHLPTARRDAARLEKETGCCAVVPAAPTFDCCVQTTLPADAKPARSG